MISITLRPAAAGQIRLLRRQVLQPPPLIIGNKKKLVSGKIWGYTGAEDVRKPVPGPDLPINRLFEEVR